ncbi:MAG: iron-siderophore ABC transporter substrate-binding protein [Leptolyngbya sp. SIOISBB]|nr:iron-siderophore ABC transporter substrate-binding protein [Leptolyngbya sp. SIOISBB]
MVSHRSLWSVRPHLLRSIPKLAPPFDRQRRFLLLTGVGALMAAACSGPAQTTDASTDIEATTTRQIQHAYGATAVPANPARVVVLGLPTIEAAMALGVEPVAAPAIVLDNLLHLPETEGEVVDIGGPVEPNLETLAATNPDLILTSKVATNEDNYRLLSQIAPTVAFDIDDFTEWKTVTQLCGEALGKEAEAAQLAANYAAKLQEFKSALDKDPSDIEISVVVIFTDRIATLGGDSFPGIVLADAGLSRPAKQVSGANVQISMELLEDIDGDAMFLLKPQGQTELAADVRDSVERTKANPLWAQLETVQAETVYEVDAYWYGAGYLAANQILDDLMTYLPD